MPLLGVNGVVVIGHGRSKAPAVVSAMGQAKRAVKGNLVEAIRTDLASLGAKAVAPTR
jgi:glycerol-3-phosphate acyltransferase PlsX